MEGRPELDDREAAILRELQALQERLARPEHGESEREELERLARELVRLVEELRRGRANAPAASGRV